MASGQRETRAGGVRALVVVGEGEGVLDGVSALVGQLAKLAATMHTPTFLRPDAQDRRALAAAAPPGRSVTVAAARRRLTSAYFQRSALHDTAN